MKRVFFCPNCHKAVPTPKMLLSGNVKVSGSIKFPCIDKKCSGKIVIKPNKKVQVENAADINNG